VSLSQHSQSCVFGVSHCAGAAAGKLVNAVMATGLCRAVEALDLASGEDQLLPAIHAVTAAACGGAEGCGGEEDCKYVAAQIAKSTAFASLLRGAHGHELCDAALHATCSLLPALAGVEWPQRKDAESECEDGEGYDLAFSHLRAAARAPHAAPCLHAVQLVWQAAEPLVSAQLQSKRGSQRLLAARCILVHDTLLAFAAEPFAGGQTWSQQARIERLLRVARLSQDTRPHVKYLALQAATLSLMPSSGYGGQEAKVGPEDKYCIFHCAIVWVHAAQLVDDPNHYVDRAARDLLHCCGHTMGGASTETVVRGENVGGGPSDNPGRLPDEAVSHLQSVGVWCILPLLVQSLGLSSLSHHCGSILAADGDEEDEEDAADEGRASLRGELRRQSVRARLKGIDAVLVALRQLQAGGRLQRTWSVHHELALLAELHLAPGGEEDGASPSCRMLVLEGCACRVLEGCACRMLVSKDAHDGVEQRASTG
jgi:hypothetical protein